MKYYANVSLEADDESSAKSALGTIPGLIEVIDGPDPDDEDMDPDDIEDEDEKSE
jgi:hypothetical protein